MTTVYTASENLPLN